MKEKKLKSRSKKNKTKKNLIFDLDETIISAISRDEFDSQKHTKLFKIFDMKDMDGYYYVFSRPGLQELLDYVFKNFNVSVWTAASKDYALFIIDKIILCKPERKLDYIFFSYHCDVSKNRKNGIKDLSILWDIYNLNNYNKYNTIIVDDNADVNATGYCIPIKEFIATDDNSEDDDYLYRLKQKLKEYKNLPDDQLFIANLLEKY
jgi:TFIIF-interacting CTD phosphatase-like protein